jgi:hypothetical protein
MKWEEWLSLHRTTVPILLSQAEVRPILINTETTRSTAEFVVAGLSRNPWRRWMPDRVRHDSPFYNFASRSPSTWPTELFGHCTLLRIGGRTSASSIRMLMNQAALASDPGQGVVQPFMRNTHAVPVPLQLSFFPRIRI